MPGFDQFRAVRWTRGEVAERSKAAVLKTARRASVSRVRIPPSPPPAAAATHRAASRCARRTGSTPSLALLARCAASAAGLARWGAAAGVDSGVLRCALGAMTWSARQNGSDDAKQVERVATWRALHEDTGLASFWWRREWDSNPRNPFGFTRSPGACLQPLGHLSAQGDYKARASLSAPSDTPLRHDGSGSDVHTRSLCCAPFSCGEVAEWLKAQVC
jgi:hypothetical protein